MKGVYFPVTNHYVGGVTEMDPNGEAEMIERRGTLKGRKIKYQLVIDGEDYGSVERVPVQGKSGIGRNDRYTAWRAGGKDAATQEGAERHLVRRQLTLINAWVPAEKVHRALEALGA